MIAGDSFATLGVPFTPTPSIGGRKQVQMTMTTGVVLADDATQTGAAVSGFVAGYCALDAAATPPISDSSPPGAPRRLPLFGVRRAHLELFRPLDGTERQDARDSCPRLSTLAKLLPLLRAGRADRPQSGGQPGQCPDDRHRRDAEPSRRTAIVARAARLATLPR
jgi:hypothetical protein